MIQIRAARPEDVPTLHQFIQDLATFEQAPDEVTSNAAHLHRALFGGDDTPSGHPALFAHVAELDGRVIGMAIWFLNYSTWTGHHGIYLEDLYVEPAARGNGAARLLMAELAGIAVDRGYDRFQWWVLDWNADAIAVYEGMGAVPMDEWTVWRLSGDALHALAGRRAAPPSAH